MESNNRRRRMTWPFVSSAVGLIFICAVTVSRFNAIDDRQTAIVATIGGMALCGVLLAVIFGLFRRADRKYVVAFGQLRSGSDDEWWYVWRRRPFERAIEPFLEPNAPRASRMHALALGDESLDVVNLPDGVRIARIPFDAIERVEEGVGASFGQSFPVLAVIATDGGERVTVPLVVQRDPHSKFRLFEQPVAVERAVDVISRALARGANRQEA